MARIFVGEMVRRYAGDRHDRTARRYWIDWNGSALTEAAKVREEIRRPDFGHLDITVTVDDPKAYTKPWTVTLRQRIVVDAELIDEVCLENEKFEKFVDNLKR